MKTFFYLQRNDRRAIMATLIVLTVAVGLTIYIGDEGQTASTTQADSTATAPNRNQGNGGGQQAVAYYDTGGRRAELFPFDPNTADSTQLLRLGLAPWQVRNIYKYRAAGGIYRQPRDFARLYGLTAGQYRRLEPYISISDDYRPAAEAYPAEPRPTYVRDTTRYPLKLKPGQHVAINTADTALLKRVPGIGSGFARAIVRYRERLGGFYSTAQLMEIGNFPQSALPYFTADPSLCRKFNVNRLTLSQLRRHPYIGFYQAKTIIDHRRLHGPLRSLDDLRLYKDFPPETIERLRHYIEF